MVSQALQNEILAFIDEVGEPLGMDVESTTAAVLNEVQRDYLPRVLSRDENVKRQVLREFQAAWRDNADHGSRRRFGRAMANLAEYCLRRTDLSELTQSDLRHAVDAIVRIGRWYYAENSLWIRFRPCAHECVELVWGGIGCWSRRRR